MLPKYFDKGNVSVSDTHPILGYLMDTSIMYTKFMMYRDIVKMYKRCTQTKKLKLEWINYRSAIQFDL